MKSGGCHKGLKGFRKGETEGEEKILLISENTGGWPACKPSTQNSVNPDFVATIPLLIVGAQEGAEQEPPPPAPPESSGVP